MSDSFGEAEKTVFVKAFGTSLLITASSTLFALILGTMAGYVLSRYEMKANKVLEAVIRREVPKAFINKVLPAS